MKNHTLLILLVSLIVSLLIYSYYDYDDYDDYVIYIPNFLSQTDYHKLIKLIQNDSRPYDINRNGLQKKTINNNQINDLFYSNQKIQEINKNTNNIVRRSRIPIEYRIYQKNKGMHWHKDILLYKEPQYECVFTISNTSTSRTEYIDHTGKKHSQWTKPNSLMIVRADGYFHHVTPVTQGKREILKLVYTPTNQINMNKYKEYQQSVSGDT